MGELNIVRPAVLWGGASALPAAAVAYLIRGRTGAYSALIAVGIVLLNALLAGVVSEFAGRVHGLASGFIALPSFFVRMGAILASLTALKGASFIDKPTFALSFGAAITVVLGLEARSFKRTPWLVKTFGIDKESS
jgi:hypothetical protein